MSLSIQERLKDLRVERGLTLGQLAEQTAAQTESWFSQTCPWAATPLWKPQLLILTQYRAM